jgi:hypothetical protein
VRSCRSIQGGSFIGRPPVGRSSADPLMPISAAALSGLSGVRHERKKRTQVQRK